MKHDIVPIGIVIIFIGFLIVILGSFFSGSAKFGFFGLIGPIPIAFGNDKKMIWSSVALGILMLVLFLWRFRWH